MAGLRYGVFYQYRMPSGAYCEPPRLFPLKPENLKTYGHPIRILVTAKMTVSLLNEMFYPTNQLSSLRVVANLRSHPLIEMFDFTVQGTDLYNAIVFSEDARRLFMPYTLFGTDANGILWQVRVFPTANDMPGDVIEGIPEPASSKLVPNQYALMASQQINKCVGCQNAAPLGEDQLCARCLLVLPD